MSTLNIQEFIDDFDNLYNNDRKTIFELFQDDVFTLAEQKEIFDGLKTKQKCQLYNTISVDSRKNFYNSLSADDAKRSGKSHAAPVLF